MVQEKLYSIAARMPGNIEVWARNKKKAIELARKGEGHWVQDDGDDIKIVGNLKRGIVILQIKFGGKK